MVFLPKVNTENRGIGLVESLWKAAEAVIDTQVKTDMQFHDVLHVFHARQEMGTSIMELNMDQYISSID